MLIATKTTVYCVNDFNDGARPEPVFQGDGTRRVAEGRRGYVVATEGGDIVLVGEGGSHRALGQIDEPIECLLVLGHDPLHLLAGTVGPYLYRLIDNGSPARRIESFDALPCRDGWHTPWGGPAAARSLAATADGWVYADIHVGSIMRSPDAGDSWEPVTPTLNEDVHEVATCPCSNDRVYANTARAVYVSDDRGTTWAHRAADLDERYGRAIAVHPEDPDCLLATVSDGPHGDDVHGALFRSEDAGRTWGHVADGFPAATADNIDTFHVAFTPSGQAWAAVGRTLHVSGDRGASWESAWESPGPIVMIDCGRGPLYNGGRDGRIGTH